jgi:hypothetical protein
MGARLLYKPLREIKIIAGDEEPGEGLPNLGDSPVSSSYSELRQVTVCAHTVKENQL